MHSKKICRSVPAGASAVAAAASIFSLTVACTDPLPLGSNIIWSANHETGDVTEWSLDGDGAGYVTDSGSGYVVVSEQAHSGSYSVKLTSSANGENVGAGLFRYMGSRDEAYFSAWYYLPRAYQTISYWTIFRFQPSSPTDPTTTALGIDLNLRSLPEGQIALYVLQQQPVHLQWPIADPAPYVAVGRWFQIEAHYRNATDNTGLLKVWLDGALVYDIEGQDIETTATGMAQDFYWTPCNFTSDMIPAPVEIYVDDAVISRNRVSIDGTTKLP
jgi:hypothetical protein